MREALQVSLLPICPCLRFLGSMSVLCRGRPFKQAATTDGKAAEDMAGKTDSAWMGRLLMTVGCAVITILLFKRMHVV